MAYGQITTVTNEYGRAIGHVRESLLGDFWAIGYVYFDLGEPEIGVEELPQIACCKTLPDAIAEVKRWTVETQKECGFCGHRAIGYSETERTDVCATCAAGILPSDPHGMFKPYQPLTVSAYGR